MTPPRPPLAANAPPQAGADACATARRVLAREAEAVGQLAARIGPEFGRAVDLVAACGGRVVVTGMGKSGLVARKIAATLSSTGAPALFLHPAEARHGDLGMLAAGDLVIALSYSGDTAEILDLLGPIQRLGLPLIAFTAAGGSPLAQAAAVWLDVAVGAEACHLNLAPTASTTAAMAMGDALAVATAERKGWTPEQFARLHPGGRLGKRLTAIGELMHAGARLPRVAPEAPLQEVLHEISRQGVGITAVVRAEDQLLGVISDGDLRRLLEQHGAAALEMPAQAYMTRHPVCLGPEALAPAALRLMEERKITALFVAAAAGGGAAGETSAPRVLGVIHLHDLWETQWV